MARTLKFYLSENLVKFPLCTSPMLETYLMCVIIDTSASSREVCMSYFSVSTCFLNFSNSWTVFPLCPICSVKSEISSVIKTELKILKCSEQHKLLFSHSETWLTLQVFILPLHGLQMIQRFFVGVLQFEEFVAQRSRLLLSALQLRLGLLVLLLPLGHDLNSVKHYLVESSLFTINVSFSKCWEYKMDKWIEYIEDTFCQRFMINRYCTTWKIR